MTTAMIPIAVYLLAAIPFVIYIGILKEKNTLLNIRIKMSLYIFIVPFLTIFICNILEVYCEQFFYSVWTIFIPLCLCLYAVIEEFLKFYLAPFILKNNMQLKTVILYTGLLFSIFETLLKFISTYNVSNLMYRLITTTPLHCFLAYTYYLTYKIFKNTKFKFIIPLIINTLLHTIINTIAHYNLLNGILLVIISIVSLIVMLEIKDDKFKSIKKKS